MYRYYLFYYDDYYPLGGMNDCILKTNNLDDLEQHIYENFKGNYWMGTIAYYDAAEDKYICADMEVYENENGFYRWRFAGWEEKDD